MRRCALFVGCAGLAGCVVFAGFEDFDAPGNVAATDAGSAGDCSMDVGPVQVSGVTYDVYVAIDKRGTASGQYAEIAQLIVDDGVQHDLTLAIRADGYVFYDGNSPGQPLTQIPLPVLGAWNHLVMSFDFVGKSGTIAINGVTEGVGLSIGTPRIGTIQVGVTYTQGSGATYDLRYDDLLVTAK